MGNNAIPRLYDELHREGFYDDIYGGNETHSGRLVLHAIPQQTESILEIGPGTGLQLKQILRKRLTIHKITAVEVAADMAAKLERRLDPILRARDGQLTVIQKRVQDAWPELAPHDVVISSYVGVYVDNIPAYIDQLYDLVNPGGVLIYLDAVEPGPQMCWKRLIVSSLLMLFYAHLREGLLLSAADLWRSFRFAQFESNPK